MKRLSLFLVGVAYLSFSNYCTVYGFVTGHGHIASATESQEQCPSEQCDHSDNDHDAASNLPCHSDTQKSDSCCVQSSSKTPVLLQSAELETKPLFLLAGLISVPSESLPEISSLSGMFRDHGPPGLNPTAPSVFLLSPRSPPSSTSL